MAARKDQTSGSGTPAAKAGQSDLIPVTMAALLEVTGWGSPAEKVDPAVRAHGRAATDEAIQLGRAWWDAWGKDDSLGAGAAQEMRALLAGLPTAVLFNVASRALYALALASRDLETFQALYWRVRHQKESLQQQQEQQQEQRIQNKVNAANTRHARTKEAKEKLLTLWRAGKVNGKYKSKTDCAEKEHAALCVSLVTARDWLKGV